MVNSKRTLSNLRNHPTHSEAVALIQNKTQTLSETNKSHAHEETEERMPDEYEFAYSAGFNLLIVAFLYGTNIFVTYSKNVSSFCQCDSVCVNKSLSGGGLVGWHLSVFPPKMY
jgi:hypothetical protein